LTAVGVAFGFSLAVSFVSGMGFVLTSTAIVMQLLGERGNIAAPRGQKIVAILLFEDLLIVPLLALVAFISPVDPSAPAAGSRWIDIAVAAGALTALVGAGIWLLNPLFRILANAKAREVMTAAALLVALGWRARDDGDQGRVHLRRGTAGEKFAHRRPGPRGADGPGRRVRLCALRRRAGQPRDRSDNQCQHDGHYRAVHGADPAGGDRTRCAWTMRGPSRGSSNRPRPPSPMPGCLHALMTANTPSN